MEERLTTSKGSYPQTNNETNLNHSKPEAKHGIIWKIDRFASHDGPGIRTLLYFKGCSLRCKLCSNPEGQTSEPELVFLQMMCTGCGLCVSLCPEVFEVGDDNIAKIKADSCGEHDLNDVTSQCPVEAIKIG